MLSRKAATRQSCFLTPLWDDAHPDWRAIDARPGPQHPARLLLHLVGLLDLQPLVNSYAGRGSLAFPPQLLLAFILLMIRRNCLSPAERARAARRDDEAKWLLRGLLPSRSLLYYFRDRLAPFLMAWRRQVVHLAIAAGFCRPEQGALDGTFVPSFASRHRLVTAATVQRRLHFLLLLAWMRDGLGWIADSDANEVERAEALLAWLWMLGWLAELGLPGWLLPGKLPGWTATSAAGRRLQLQHDTDTRDRLDADRAAYQQRQRQQAKKRRVPAERRAACLTDLQAALGRDKYGLFGPLVDVLLLNSLEGDWVLFDDVLATPTDQGTLPETLKQAREQVGIVVKEVVVDDGFVNLLDLQECKQDGVVVYAPVEEEKKPTGKMLPKAGFRWDPVEQIYRCPQGHPLPERRRTKASRQRPEGKVELPVVIYGCAGEHCMACPQQQKCTKTPKSGREVKRFEGEEVVEDLRERMRQPQSQRQYRKRRQSVERSNAEAKEHRGLRVFHSYGQERAKIQVGLATLTMNGLRFEKCLRQSDEKAQADPLAPVA